MATLELECSGWRCEWWAMSNEDIPLCPKCGAKTIKYWDEDEDNDDFMAREGSELGD